MKQSWKGALAPALAVLALTAACTSGGSNTTAPAGPKRIAIITPSHDNPFFKAEADAASARAKELGLSGVRINMAGCLDRCEFGPTVVVYPEGVWYKIETKDDVDEVLAAHLVAGGRVPRLMLTERDVPPPKEPKMREAKRATEERRGEGGAA